MSARTPRDSFQFSAGVLALLVHTAFFAFLYFGINWQVEAPRGMVVDIWESLPDPATSPEAKAPEAKPPEDILPALPPPPVAPAKPLPPPEPAQTDIELDKSKTLKAKRAEQVKQEQAKREKQAQAERDRLGQLEKEKLAQVELEKQAQLEKERQAKLEKEKLQAERIKQVQAEHERQAQVERDTQAQRQVQVERERQVKLDREKQAQAEQAAATGKVMAEYIGKIQTKIRRNIVLPPEVPDNAKAVFDVTLLPGGAVLSVRLSAPSGSGPYDSAVERAILKAHTLPVPPDPALFNRFRELRLTFCPKEELCK